MEVTIGVQNVARELVLETDQSSETITEVVRKAVQSGAPLDLTDRHGRRIIVPAATLGYVEVGGDETRRVGFHNI